MYYLTYGTEAISRFDLFGKKIDINYRKKGSEYKTFIGGVASIFIQAFVVFVLSMRLYQMITQADPVIS